MRMIDFRFFPEVISGIGQIPSDCFLYNDFYYAYCEVSRDCCLFMNVRAGLILAILIGIAFGVCLGIALLMTMQCNRRR